MRQVRELTGHEKFTPQHAALLVFCLDSMGCCFIRAAARESSLPALLGILVFVFCSWYGILLLAWQPPGPYPLMVLVSLTVVNGVWSVSLLLRDPGTPFREEHLVWAAVLCGLGVLVTLPILILRRRTPPTWPALR